MTLNGDPLHGKLKIDSSQVNRDILILYCASLPLEYNNNQLPDTSAITRSSTSNHIPSTENATHL